MKLQLYITVFALFLFFKTFSQTNQFVVSENGIGDLTRKSKIEDVYRIFGNDFTKKSYIAEYETTITIKYETKGLSFTFDSIKNTSNEIVLTAPCNYSTDKGIVLQSSTYADVIKLYGNPETTITKSKMFGVRYGDIKFLFNKIPNVSFIDNPESYLNSVIIRIDLLNYY